MRRTYKRAFTLFLAVILLMSSFAFSVSAKTETGLSIKRQTVIEEMKKMATIKWKPSKTFKTYYYYAYSGSGSIYNTWTKGKTYYGIPYSQNPNIVNPINKKICVTYDVFKKSLGKGNTLSRDLGRNDCSSAVVMALQTVDKKIELTFTSRMRPGVNNLVAVGNYTYHSDKATTCRKNGSSVMYSCYSKMKPGDLLIKDGHAIMVVGVDKNKKELTVIHQTQLKKHYYPKTDTAKKAKNNGDINTTWSVNEKMSFSSVWNDGYIPLASKTLIEDDKKTHSITMCEKVKNLAVSKRTSSSITLSWKKDKKATGYIVYKFEDGQFVKIGTTKKTSFTVEDIYSAKDHRLAVKSYLKVNGKTHTCIDFSIIVATTTPRKVTGVSATIKNNKAQIKWNKVNRAEKYLVYQSSEKDGKFKYIGYTKTTSFTTEKLPKGDYYYKVKAAVYRDGEKIYGEVSKIAKAE